MKREECIQSQTFSHVKVVENVIKSSNNLSDSKTIDKKVNPSLLFANLYFIKSNYSIK